MERPHATPVRLDDKPSSPELLRSVVLPAAAAVTLVVLFFTLLLSSPLQSPETTPDRTPAVEPGMAPAAAVTMMAASCDVPTSSGQAGIVSERFAGKATSSGHRYDPEEASCIVNAAGALGELPYQTTIRLHRADDAGLSADCRIVGRWQGAQHTDRIVLVSGAVAHALEIGTSGLVEVVSDCPGVAEVHARLR